MSSDVEFTLNIPAFNAILKSGGVQSLCESAAQAAAARAGGDYEVRIEHAHAITFTSVAAVWPRNKRGRLDNNKNNTLLKAVGATKV